MVSSLTDIKGKRTMKETDTTREAEKTETVEQVSLPLIDRLFGVAQIVGTASATAKAYSGNLSRLACEYVAANLDKGREMIALAITTYPNVSLAAAKQVQSRTSEAMRVLLGTDKMERHAGYASIVIQWKDALPNAKTLKAALDEQKAQNLDVGEAALDAYDSAIEKIAKLLTISNGQARSWIAEQIEKELSESQVDN